MNISLMDVDGQDFVEIMELITLGDASHISKYFTKETRWCWVAKEAEVYAGYLLYIRTNRKIVITRLHILPEYRLKGKGRELINHLIKRAKGTKIVCYVEQNNLGMQMFLNKVGFKGVTDNDVYRFTYMPKM